MNKKILVVEDEKGITKILRLFLKSQGFEPLSAANGAQAIEMIREQCPDLVLLDIFLPDVSGFEVLEKVRKFSQVPIIVVSANTSAVEGALQAGANAAIAKPFNPDHLLEKIRSVIVNDYMPVGLDTRLLRR